MNTTMEELLAEYFMGYIVIGGKSFEILMLSFVTLKSDGMNEILSN